MWKYLGPFILLLGTSSCGIDLLDMDIPAGEAQLVIEGSISNLPPPHGVNISWSTSFNSQSENYEPNALVILSNSEGEADTLTYTGNGRYESGMEGKPDMSYQLSVELNGKHYKAISRMPAPASVDSVSIAYFEESPIREEGYYISLHKPEPDRNIGYYRWKVWVNDSLLQVPASLAGYFAVIDTSQENFPMRLEFPQAFRKGDHLRFQTIKMDEQVFAYYQGMQEMMLNDGGLMGPVPLNPTNNFSGNALGIFQAIAIQEAEIIVE